MNAADLTNILLTIVAVMQGIIVVDSFVERFHKHLRTLRERMNDD